MGLDHFLMKKEYLENSNEETFITLIEWRKENQIHSFFDAMTGGIENCEYEKIDREILETLLSHCKFVMENPNRAEEIMPTVSGFFFGSTDYGDWYHESVARTYNKLKEILKNEPLDTEFYYYAWW